MKLGKSQKANQFLESLKAEGEDIVEDVRPSANSSRSAAPPPTDPITLTTEEKLNVTLKRDGGVSNFDVQGTLSLQVLNQDDGFIQVQVGILLLLSAIYIHVICILYLTSRSNIHVLFISMKLDLLERVMCLANDVSDETKPGICQGGLQ